MTDARSDRDGGFTSAKQDRGGSHLPEGLTFSFDLDGSMERELVQVPDRQSWDRREVDGEWRLIWPRGCGCGREDTPNYPEEELRERVWSLQGALGELVVPVPI